MERNEELKKNRKTLHLQGTKAEVLVLTTPKMVEGWNSELTDSLSECARRGVRIKLLVEGEYFPSSKIRELESIGAQIRSLQRKLAWLFRPFPVQNEIWIYDREQAVVVNERISSEPISNGNEKLALECSLGDRAARGLSAYFDLRWRSASEFLTYSVRHKDFSFHSGKKVDRELFGCLLNARKEITLSLPRGRISRHLESALHQALRNGLKVTIFANAQSSDAYGLRRLRRLAFSGATVKICGRRLGPECAVVDERCVYIGPFPGAWKPWSPNHNPAFVVQHPDMSQEILSTLEQQVSVEINVTAIHGFR